MKKYILTILTLFLFSCTEVIDLNLETSPPRLVIDARLEVDANDSNIFYMYVLLSKSQPYFDYDFNELEVKNAEVVIKDTTNNIEYKLENTNPSFQFLYTYSGNNLVDTNADFELTIKYDTQIYTATSRFSPPPKILNISDKKNENTILTSRNYNTLNIQLENRLNEEDYFIGKVSTYDASSSLFDAPLSVSETSFDFIDDTFYLDDKIEYFVRFDEEDVIGEDKASKLISIYSVDRAYFNYYKTMSSLSNSGGGRPFQSARSTIFGNIVNKTNPSNYPLGYFYSSIFTNKIYTLTDL